MKKSKLLFALMLLPLVAGCDSNKDSGGGADSIDFGFDGDGIAFHYKRKDNDFTDWDMWIWEKGNDGAGFDFNYKDSYGAIAAYPLSTWTDAMANTLGFLVRKGGSSWTTKDPEADRYVDLNDFEKDDSGVYHIYLVSGDANVYSDSSGTLKPAVKKATFVNSKKVSIHANLGIDAVALYMGNTKIAENLSVGGGTVTELAIPDSVSLDYAAKYTVKVTFRLDGSILESNVSKNALYTDSAFEDAYDYDGDDLGAVYTSASTTFKVWSPLSTSLKLRIYNSGTPTSVDKTNGNDTYSEYELTKGDKGVWSYTATGDLAGKYYTYVVTNSAYTNKEVVDPYAKSAGVNGLRGQIVDFSKTNPTGWDEIAAKAIDRKAMTVYETHVADVSSSTTWGGTAVNAKLFKGMYESGTTYTSGSTTVKTGFDHIKELGVNAVQIIPLFDQANDETNMTFNWGYNPLNYNVVEGGYSSNPYDGYTRIKEFKELVQAYNGAGINVIMDVVYNHVNSAPGSNFDVLMPEYYFRYTDDGSLSNGSGCGNETASEHYMMRKFIKDSVYFWTKEYKLGGFRFDLMGLHDIETMNEVTAKAKTANENVVIYGEPWQGGTSTLADSDSAKQSNGNYYEGYGAFNDQMRDALIKGGLSGAAEVGWVTNEKSKISSTDKTKITRGIKGITAASTEIADPDKTVNYVTCHDNYTLYDRIKATGAVTDENTVKKMNVLANSIVFTSQGTTFMQAGEEFLRTKGGNSNSYNASYKVNELDYSLKAKNLDVFNNYAKLISLKQNVDGLHLDKDAIKNLDVTMNSANSMVSYTIGDSENGKTYKIVHANGLAKDLTVDFDGYELYLDTLGEKTLSKTTEVGKFETIIASKSAS